MEKLLHSAAEHWLTSESDEVDVEDIYWHNLIIWKDAKSNVAQIAKSLVDICDHTPLQAEQCALIIQNTGKYSVKAGSFKFLYPRAVALIERGLHATIDA